MSDWAVDELSPTALWGTVYVAVLLLAGLAVNAWLFCFRQKPRSKRALVAPWKLNGLEFLLLLLGFFGLFLIGTTLVQMVGQQWFPEDALRQNQVLYGGVGLVQVGLIGVWWFFRAQGTEKKDKPLNLQPQGPLVWLGGGLLGMLATLPWMLAVNLLWLWLAGLLGYEITPQAQIEELASAQDPLLIGLIILVAVVGAPVMEELVFRGGIYRYLRGVMPVGVAIGVSALLFSLAHFHPSAMPALLVVGVGLCVNYELTGDLRVAMAHHAWFNANTILTIWLFGSEMGL